MPRTARYRCVRMGLALLVSSASTILLAQATATFSGAVFGSDGKSLGATIVVRRAGPSPAAGHADTGSDGVFSIRNLPAGAYTVCAQSKSSGYLDPCAWSPAPPVVHIAAGQAIAAYRLVLQKGSVVQVRLNDPARVLDTPAAVGKTAPRLLPAILSPRHLLQPLQLTAKDSQGRTHEGTVPLDRVSSLYLIADGMQITDTVGAAIKTNGPVAAVNPAGAAVSVFTFNLSPKP